MTLSDYFHTLSHHAYCIPGDPAVCVEIKTILLDIHDIPAQANPDFYEQAYQTFTIEDARNLKGLHETRPIGPTGKKVFVISMNSITSEAQNALLKLLEEPAEYAHFFLVIPSSHLLLPTVRSRLYMVGHDATPVSNGELRDEARNFLRLGRGKRLDQIKKIVDDISKEKKTRQDAIEFLNAVESEMYAQGKLKGQASSFEAIAVARKYIHDRAPSVKMLLEYMALIA